MKQINVPFNGFGVQIGPETCDKPLKTQFYDFKKYIPCRTFDRSLQAGEHWKRIGGKIPVENWFGAWSWETMDNEIPIKTRSMDEMISIEAHMSNANKARLKIDIVPYEHSFDYLDLVWIG